MRSRAFKLCAILLLAAAFALGTAPLFSQAANAAQTTFEAWTVSFDPGTGTGEMDSVLVDKGAEYELPACAFTKTGAKFYRWLVNGTEYAAGTTIAINADTEAKAIWNNKTTIDGSVDKSTSEVVGTLTITDATTGETQVITTFDEVTSSSFTDPRNPTVQAMIGEAKDANRAKAQEIAGSAEVTFESEDTSDPSILKWQDNRTFTSFSGEKNADGDYDSTTIVDGDYWHNWGYTVTTTASFESQPEHTHQMSEHPGAEATCTKAGNKPYYSCEGCGKWFVDEAGTEEIVDHSEVVIPALGHDWSEWEIVREATEDEDGLRVRSCSRCDSTQTEVIPWSEQSDTPTPENPDDSQGGNPEENPGGNQGGAPNGNQGGNQGGAPNGNQGGNPGGAPSGNQNGNRGGTPATGEPASIAGLLAAAGGALVALTRKRRR